MTLFLDMDGVAADFTGTYQRRFGYAADTKLDNVDWDLVHTVPHFFRDLDPMPDFMTLWRAVEHLNPIFLTGVPVAMPVQAAANKREWIDRVLGPTVPMIGCHARDKFRHANRGDVLVDDWTKYRQQWLIMGGWWVTHINADLSVLRLQDLGVI